MKTSYPTSYPYSNKHGLVFTKETLELVAEYFLTRKSPHSENIGLELAYIMRWAMEKASDHLHFIKLVYSLFKRAVHRRPPKSKLGDKVDVLLERIVDPESEMIEGRLIRGVDVERVIGPPAEITRLANLRARDRNAAIAKLRKHWEGD